MTDSEFEDLADALDAPPEQVDQILEDVEAALRDVAQMDVDVDEPADLDRARQRLPTDPHRAALVEAALPRALRESIEYVRPSERQAGYWRRSRERRDPSALSDAELRQRLDFVRSQREQRGTEGTVSTPDGREIPRTAAKTREKMTGNDYSDADAGDRGKGKGLLTRILSRI